VLRARPGSDAVRYWTRQFAMIESRRAEEFLVHGEP
jgi:hypothetical protein